ncbi:ABC transporter ATP-binding protein [Treponema parvum]|uniref:ABC transporter ATP-binding protein n=1 Tax=Treponema parvum TaxID=138851 RepID=UPI001AEBBC5C|nr:ABC transporter ATP-binding protein [Treponema parvum]QTQ15911.1 ABC transporter ATP-binding protein [Treponema parvum]
MLEVCNLTKRYGAKFAIKDLTFSAAENEIVGIVGHNGSGKSTTMNIITGFITQTSGYVKVDGVDTLKSAKLARSKIGYLPEIPALYYDFTVEEQLRFSAKLRKIENPDYSVEEACRKTDILGIRGRLIRNLSKGYKQRVGLAQAFIGNPPLIILDEPSNGLDPQQVSEMRDIIKDESKSHTIVLSSHILNEVELLCDHIVVLNKGTITADGKISYLKEKYMEPDLYDIRLKGLVDSKSTLELKNALEKIGYSISNIDHTLPSLESVFLKINSDNPSGNGDKNESRL